MSPKPNIGSTETTLSELSQLLTQLLRAERRKVLVQRINAPTALHQLQHNSHIPIRSHHHNTSSLFVQTHLSMRRCLCIRHAMFPYIIRIDMLPVARQQTRYVPCDLDVAALGSKDSADGVEQTMRIVLLVMGHLCDVRPLEGAEKGAFLAQVIGKVVEGPSCELRTACENVDAE